MREERRPRRPLHLEEQPDRTGLGDVEDRHRALRDARPRAFHERGRHASDRPHRRRVRPARNRTQALGRHPRRAPRRVLPARPHPAQRRHARVQLRAGPGQLRCRLLRERRLAHPGKHLQGARMQALGHHGRRAGQGGTDQPLGAVLVQGQAVHLPPPGRRHGGNRQPQGRSARPRDRQEALARRNLRVRRPRGRLENLRLHPRMRRVRLLQPRARQAGDANLAHVAHERRGLAVVV